MAHFGLKSVASSALLILLIGKAVFACTVTSSDAADMIRAESLSALQLYHFLIVLVGAITIGLFILRRGKGLVQLIVCLILITISPGWFAYQNAGITPMCEPAFAFEIKVLSGIAVICAIWQTFSWYGQSKRRMI